MSAQTLPAHLEGLDRYEPGLSLEEVRRELGPQAEVVKLASNENPLGPSPRALEAARRAVSGVHRYPDGPGRELREELAARAGVAPSQAILGNGSTDLIDLAARACLGPDDDAVCSQAAFARFRQVVRARNGRVVEVPTTAGRGHDLDRMRAAITPRTRLVYVANPNNPTGTWLGRRALEAFVASLPPHVLVLLDEAYFEFSAHEADYPDGLDLLRGGASVLVLRTFSKAHGLAGLRVGYGFAPAPVIAALDTIREPFNTNAIGQAAALAALGDEGHVQRTVALARAERARLEAGLAARGLSFTPGLGNFVMVDVPGAAGVVFRALLRQGVIVRPLGAYGYEGSLRISVGLPHETDRVLAAFDAALPAPGRA